MRKYVKVLWTSFYFKYFTKSFIGDTIFQVLVIEFIMLLSVHICANELFNHLNILIKFILNLGLVEVVALI
jgi:hypothetical protein